MTVKTTIPGLRGIFQPSTNASHFIKPWSVFLACAAGEAFLLYAILIGRTLSPVTLLLIGPDSGSRGAATRYHEIFNWDGLIPTLLGSLFVAAAVWSALQLTGRLRPQLSLNPHPMALTDPFSGPVINLTEPAGQ